MNSCYKNLACIFSILVSFMFSSCGAGALQSKEKTPALTPQNKFHRPKGAGPKYWIAYEYCFTTNSPIPEEVWKANIDWMDTTFKSYGYDMVSNDGWIEGAQTINPDGYITKYNDAYVNGFQYWSDYVAAKGMKLGIYYNPMWLTKAAYDRNVKVKGTNYRAREIVGTTSFNDPLYWVDVAKPGAKEWIQGYVNQFIEFGATYLRIDFLENYERNYGTEKYAQALHWIKEAAGDKILVSLVMPNCFNHAQTELLVGDMIRIDDDCFNGGWDFVSDRRRGERRANWPQYGNAFDGFIAFADIGGRGQMILDGDFIRLNTLANDTQRKFQVSLFVMAGSPITIADQYNTIGNSAWVYRNTELLDLNNRGFIGKPLSYDSKDTANSSTWMGQLPDGDWIVGLFNRESSTQIRTIDFAKDLGITGGTSDHVRDLWAHTDLGMISGVYSVNLSPHDCQILKIKNNPDPTYEAEVASMMGGAKKNTNHHHYGGAGFVDKLETVGAGVLFAASVKSEGNYQLNVRYANATGTTRTASIYVNNAKQPRQLKMPKLANWDTWNHVSKTLFLKEGVNYITVQYDPEDNGLFHLDYIQIKQR